MKGERRSRKSLRILVPALLLFGALLAVMISRNSGGQTVGLSGHDSTRPKSGSNGLASKKQLAERNVLQPAELTSLKVYGVVRGTDGSPIHRATVCASCAHCDHAFLASALQCVETDTNGAYSLEGLRAGEYLLSASAAGYAPAAANESEFLVLGNEGGASELEIDIELEEGGALVTGVVMDALGGMVGGATVRAVSYASRGRNGRLTQTTIADDEGRFSLTGVPGRVVLSAAADGYAPAEASRTAPCSGVKLVVTPASRISGRVLTIDRQLPVSAAKVRAEGPPWSREQATTDEAGHFEIASLRPGVYRLTATGDGWLGAYPTTVSLDLVDVVEDVVILVSPAASVRGSLAVGQSPCTEGNVSMGPAPGDVSLPTLWAPANSDGSVAFEAVPAGTYMVSASCRGYGHQALEPLEVGDQDLSGLRWVIQRGLSIEGRVVDPGGNPVSNLGMHLITEQSSFLRDTPVRVHKPFRTDSDGSFSLKGLSEGSYVIKTEYLDAPVEVELSEETSPVNLELVVNPIGHIAVAVVTPQGEPFDGLTVYATTDATGSRPPAYQALPLGAGSYRLGPLAPGSYPVYVSDSVNPPVRAGGPSGVVEVVSSETTNVKVEFGGFGGRIVGRVIDDAGAPLANVYVSVTAKGFDGSPLAHREYGKREQEALDRITDAEGRFAFEGLAADGVFDLIAKRAQGGQRSLENVEPGSAVEIVLPSVGKISGSAVNADGEPVEQFQISLNNPDSKEERSEAFAHRNGVWQIEHVSPGPIHIAARSVAGNKGTAELILKPREHRSKVRLVLGPAPEDLPEAVNRVPPPRGRTGGSQPSRAYRQ